MNPPIGEPVERKAGEVRKYREIADDLRRRVSEGEFDEGRRKLPRNAS